MIASINIYREVMTMPRTIKAPKKTITAPAKAAKSVETKNEIPVFVEFPRENEMIMPVTHYGIRVASPSGTRVEISINGGTWNVCRFDTGHYWFDWFPTKPGAQKISARARLNDGPWTTTKDLTCQVIERRSKN